jgi:hypothetical protein
MEQRAVGCLLHCCGTQKPALWHRNQARDLQRSPALLGKGFKDLLTAWPSAFGGAQYLHNVTQSPIGPWCKISSAAPVIAAWTGPVLLPVHRQISLDNTHYILFVAMILECEE